VRRAVAEGLPPVSSVFVGGGTPSLLEPGQLAAVLDALPRRPGAEVTVECNPETVTEEKLAGYAAAGVTRISLGVQSLVPRVLASLGRVHDPGDVSRAVAAVRAVGFASWNLDVIYGAAGETADDWRRTIDGVLALDPPHVSAYALTVEPGTPLADDPARAPDDDVQAEAYLVADAAFTAAGLANYEISNWARPGSECRHNLLYWSAGTYRGFGCAAHSHGGGRRWWNVRTPERYVAAIAAGRSPEAAGEALPADQRRLEALQLSLRTRTGVPAAALAPEDRADLDGLLVPEGDRLVLSVRGRLLANEVAVRLRVPDRR
jgi:putative oxygen-independent coproporphyrinogen III oxidase